eukprot:TRINITY_DN38561_c0_g1_i2.p1 TRINITY_DN38561_c0_g1~~TRINITY_DN38561_c0_g1_i2.p1  ORF type:complete len:395 (+),score=71.54 TRINITY_DN38561_c0_g1_i2:72-1256(+)
MSSEFASISGRDHKLGGCEIQGKIGEGTYGVVFKCRLVSSGEIVCIKRSKVHPNSEPTVTLSEIREIKLLRELCQINSPYKKRIVDLMDVYVDKQRRLNLMYRYVELDLEEIIRYHKQRKVALSGVIIKSVVFQVLEGVKFLHNNWVIHRDLKPSNILVSRSDATRDKGQVKIADFGMSRLFQDPFARFNLVDQVVVTSWYRAPELLLGSYHYTCSIDLWSVGCIFAEMVMRSPVFWANAAEKQKNGGIPFEKEQVEKVFKELGPPKHEDWAELNELPNWRDAQLLLQSSGPGRLSQFLQQNDLDEKGVDLVTRCLEYNPNTRISASEALDLFYFKEIPLPLQNNIFEDQLPEPIFYPTRQVVPIKVEDDVKGTKRPRNDTKRPAPPANKTSRY